MWTKIKRIWLSISEVNRKRIVSFLNTFTVSYLLLLATSLGTDGFPSSIAGTVSLAMAIGRTAIREALNALVRSFKTKE